MTNLSPQPVRSSRWGAVQHVTPIAEGIDFVSTAGHGGIVLSDDRQQEMHPALRISGNQYEEDCEYSLVVINFPQFFKPDQVADAHRAAKEWFPDQYGKWSKKTVPTEESYILRQRASREANADKYVTLSAWGDWHKDVPKGMVGVFAGKGGRLRNGQYPADCKYFLVPAEEYDSRGEFGFVIDEAKHKTCAKID